MVSTSKILTVSYGTFSCTLEGFDDSFDTMKAIAEYFRDLAQDDRYFGAEPPTPDAEMLARIAEREIARRVEARVQDGSVVLRPSLGQGAEGAGVATTAQTETAAAAAPEAVTAPAPAAAEPAPEAPPPEQRTLARAAETSSSFPAEAKIAGPETGADAANPGGLATLAAASGAFPPEADEASASPEWDTVAEDPAAALAVEEAVGAAGATPDADEIGAPDAAPADPKAFAGTDLHGPEPVTPATNPDDSISEKLRRIRAVVGTSAVGALVASADTEEDEGPRAHITLGDDIAEEEADAQPDTIFSDSIAAIMADSVSEEDQTADKERPETARARVLKVKQAEFDAAVAAGTLEAVEDDTRAEGPDPAGSSLSDEDEKDLARELAALEAELAGDEAPEADDTHALDDESDGIDDVVADAGPAEDASPEAEEDPADALADTDDRAAEIDEDDGTADAFERELDAAFSDLGFDTDEEAEADTPAGADQASTPAPEPDEGPEADDAELGHARRAVKLANPGRAMLTETPVEEDEGAVSRLMSDADREFEEPEGNRRRSAIAHLRAAVAATRADRLLGRRRDDAEAAEPYREDLASVVRPRRPQPAEDGAAASPRPARPAATRPAPLKLVAEQRVDTESAPAGASEERPAGAVRPRRIRRSAIEEAAPAPAAPGQSFADYADSVGARALPDLLEAAAAYMSYVEERPQFSRPQLMTKLREVEPAESSREDRLRSFGQLLREGKIAKLEGGRFTASDRIGFKPERAAG
ncbi:midas domain-containing protein [Roseivivax sediminis]|uniref:Lipoprotein n=1 Tax=Roseivivax sediminis TaxID=936889 RepID=A0A1I2AU06_9RHOB|nr:hypothetical protein [Roseivivax sediminis]SFE47451.1 hypothetical protein SAMN04515678_11064 [Roseivivax sediminis]